MINPLYCENVSLDLSVTSTRITSHPHLLVFIALLLSIIAGLIIFCNSLMIIVLGWSRRDRHQHNLSDSKWVILISFHLNQLIVGSFCMPLDILEVISNGQWKFGHKLCIVRAVSEALTEIISIYHTVSLCLDVFLMVNNPIRYRLFTVRTGLKLVTVSWTLPSVIFAVSIGLGWYNEGIEHIYKCLDYSNICIMLFSKKFSQVIMISTIAMSVVMTLAMAVSLLKVINRIHKRLRKRNKSKSNIPSTREKNKNQNAGSEGSQETINVCNPPVKVSQKCINYKSKIKNNLVENDKIHNNQSIAVIASDKLYKCSKQQIETGTPNLVDASATYDNDMKAQKIRKWKTYGFIIAITIVKNIYLLSFLVFYSMFVYHPETFQIWWISTIVWMRYLYSAVTIVCLSRQKAHNRLIKAFFNIR